MVKATRFERTVFPKVGNDHAEVDYNQDDACKVHEALQIEVFGIAGQQAHPEICM